MEAVHIPNEPGPFDAIRIHIDDLYSEAKNFADGKPIETQGQADAVQSLMRQIQEAEKLADAERVKENDPFDKGKAEVQARYAPLIANTKAVKGKTVLAIEALKASLSPWLQRVADEQEAARQKAKAEADAAAQKAQDALRSAQGLADKEQAESLADDAKAASRALSDAEKARPQASGYGRAATLRSVWKPNLSDVRQACRHYFTERPEAFEAVVQKLAEDDVRSGKRSIPGFNIIETKVVA